MLKRLYVHNYKCLVNFEINFDQDISLFLGANGSGKTSILIILRELQKLILRKDELGIEVFKSNTLTRWTFGKDNIQKIELDIDGNDGSYKYVLEIEHQTERGLVRLKKENLYFNDEPLFTFQIEQENGMIVGNGRLFNDMKTNPDGIFYPVAWSSSGIGTVQERYDNKKLTWFKKWLERIFIAHINPSSIKIEINTEEMIRPQHPKWDVSNYAAWLFNSNRQGFAAVENSIREIISGFSFFDFPSSGEKKILEVKINKCDYKFNELSDGQKSLIVLYTLIYCTPENSLICIDEPENFLALPEIQPWLNALRDQCSERNLQVILISHHPSLINFLTANSGYWFSREDNHTRIQRITKQNEGGLSFAQLIELGWIYEG
ncbi:MAG: AAA family ATPase [Methylococcales bacterium]